MSVLKQLKGITKRTIKYLTKDVYDVGTDKTLDKIIEELKGKVNAIPEGGKIVPTFDLRCNFTSTSSLTINSDDLKAVFAYIRKNARFNIDAYYPSNQNLPTLRLIDDYDCICLSVSYAVLHRDIENELTLILKFPYLGDIDIDESENEDYVFVGQIQYIKIQENVDDFTIDTLYSNIASDLTDFKYF